MRCAHRLDGARERLAVAVLKMAMFSSVKPALQTRAGNAQQAHAREIDS